MYLDGNLLLSNTPGAFDGFDELGVKITDILLLWLSGESPLHLPSLVYVFYDRVTKWIPFISYLSE